MISLAYNRIKKYQYSTIIPVILIVIEFGIIFLLLDLIKSQQPILGVDLQSYFLLSINLALGWVIAGVLTGSYQLENMDGIRKIIVRSFLSSLVYLGLIFVTLGLSSESKVDMPTLLKLCFFTLVSIIILRVFILSVLRIISQMAPNRKKAIIVGSTPRARELSRYFLTTASLPQQFLGFFDNNFPTSVTDMPFYLGKLEEIQHFCKENQVDEIYYALDQQRGFYFELSKFADENFIFLGIIPDVDGLDFGRRMDTIMYNDSRIPIITSRKVPLQLVANWYVKRAFDIIFSAFVLFILSLTAFPLIAIAIKLNSPGPILFKQLRPGRNNQLFWCYKFRSMKINSDDRKQAMKNDNRITKVGAFLRKTSLDELPQFFNVLKGDMSVVGPRPNLVVHLEQYPKEIKEYSLRHWVTPGITGYAQVSGFRGETKETYLMQKRVEYDLKYIENWRLSLDLQIIGRTVWNIVKGEKNAY